LVPSPADFLGNDGGYQQPVIYMWVWVGHLLLICLEMPIL
jgi:hypothetical protein